MRAGRTATALLSIALLAPHSGKRLHPTPSAGGAVSLPTRHIPTRLNPVHSISLMSTSRSTAHRRRRGSCTSDDMRITRAHAAVLVLFVAAGLGTHLDATIPD